MKATYYLLSLTVNGIKNIEHQIVLDFYNKTVDKNFNPSKFNLKAIYGENGTGKTAIVTAVQILKKLLISGYLGDSDNQKKLSKLVNKRTKKFDISVEFIRRNDPNADFKSVIYNYAIEVALKESGLFEIEREKLLEKSGEYSSSSFKTVYECSKGQLIDADLSDPMFEMISRQSINLLDKKTLAKIVIEKITENTRRADAPEFYRAVINLLFFALNINVSLEESDQHDVYIVNEEISIAKAKNDLDEAYRRMFMQMDLMIRNDVKNVLKLNYEEYKTEVAKLEAFLKLFKHDLLSIDIDRKDNGDYYETRLVLNYGDYSIDTEFESNGIKKLIKLFNYLNYAVSGNIVFIDEMDSNINDIYLTKLVEFFMKYGQGQLCFTTHNTSPMSILRQNRKSIDFLSSDNKVISWKNNGNFSPEKLYRQGLIEYLPFNVEAEDFLGILGA